MIFMGVHRDLPVCTFKIFFEYEAARSLAIYELNESINAWLT